MEGGGTWDRGGPELASSLRPTSPVPLAVLAAGEADEPGLVRVSHGVGRYREGHGTAMAKRQGAPASRATLGLLTIPPRNPAKKLLLK